MAKLPEMWRWTSHEEWRNCRRCGDGPPTKNGETAVDVATVLPRKNWQNWQIGRKRSTKTPKEFKTARSEQNLVKRTGKLETEHRKILGRVPHKVPRHLTCHQSRQQEEGHVSDDDWRIGAELEATDTGAGRVETRICALVRTDARVEDGPVRRSGLWTWSVKHAGRV
ncbi:hypothetical protein PIB30_023138 [Stylosanthes scabra]|uniref:Uncharacterized protein n=1 Tax=Stylosanthes scabra TaxID=79078 RepID=A0ABU6R9L0_9FABA|nr:hypothetical protein [Stylosanthes scabra]